MLPKSLYSSYEQYKTDSDYVANWLATTARTCGYVDHEAPSTATAKTSTRLKGKARKQAREATSTPTATSSTQQRKHCVKIKDFARLAKVIADSTEPRVKVPKAFTYRLRRAINQRKFLRTWYSAQGQATRSADIHDGHEHFIGVLEQVAKLLRPNEAPSTEAEAGTDDTSTSFANMFEGLHIEEPVDNSKDEQSDSMPDVAGEGEFTSELGTNKDEALTALMWLYIDVHRIRKLIQGLWRLYRQGDVDLAAVSITTNTAIDFVRSLEDDFATAFTDSGRDSLCGRLCLYCAYQQDPDNVGVTPDFPYEPCLLFVQKITATLLRDFVKDPSDYVPGVSPQYTELYDPHADWATMATKERIFHHFKMAMGVIPEFLVLERGSKSVEAEHGIVRGLRDLKQRKSPLLWLDFALQVFLDARHILREHVDLAFADLCQGAESIVGDIEEVLDFHADVKVKDRPMQNDDSLRQVLDLIARWTKEDSVESIRKDLLKDESAYDHLEPFYLLRRDPLWCGLLLYKFRLVAYEGAIVTANSWFSILSGAHFYNLLRQTGPLRREWTDMETALKAQSSAKLFIGDPPSSPTDCTIRFLMALGLSPTALARNRRNSDIRLNQDKAKKLKTQSPVYWIFKHCYCDNSGRVDFQPSDFEKILQKTSKSKDETAAVVKPNDGIDMCHLLLRLCSALHLETKEVTFNYFDLHIQCWKLFRRLRDSLGDRFPDWSSYPHGEEHLPTLPYFLMSELVMPSTGNKSALRGLVDEAGRIVDDVVVSEGDRASRRQAWLLGRSVIVRQMAGRGTL
ncbi:hypothetical protein M409DRAFT_22778 [Zasmidium cellare ATCC 36951]|uniref:DUF6604 domain-containing protein n=1 Tax=Zasmidium cellare ATCC 36951 TaxID=1080233 RepID=A0A6A6CLB3_ZASCE|nr:uncharacterized protein M409DRAFT_22778 [Zasmidium cellare ATCC 36951]KAF2166722.1 hypothetical protein M409DRAFT_22778 [Zasmidium cellare ATCC 36951]